MTRIGTLGANNAYIARILDIQGRMNIEQVQNTTHLKSQEYIGIASDANAAINFENEKAQAAQFISNNKAVDTKLSAASAALTEIQTTIKNFRDQAVSFYSSAPTDQQSITQFQTFAFQAMQEIQSALYTSNNGQYLFSGGRVNTEPMQLPASSLSQFQSLFDGSNRTWPTTRGAQLLEANVTSQDTAKLTFSPTSGLIRAANATGLTQFPAGTNITVGNSLSNNKTFVVHSHALMNVGGSALAETNGLGSGSPTIQYGATPTAILPAATGDLNFAFRANGNMAITPTTAGSLANLTVGTRFTINGSTGASWDGAYKVVSNVNGVVEIASDTGQATSEAITQTAGTTPVTMSFTHLAATTAVPLTAGTVTMTATPSAANNNTTVTITAAGTADFAGIAVGDTITLGGSANHNGTYTVTGQTANTLTFAINGDALRVSKFLPQTGRTDVTLSYQSGTAASPKTTSILPNHTGSIAFTPGSGVGQERITSSVPGNGTVGTTVTVDGSGSGDQFHLLTDLTNKTNGVSLGIAIGQTLTLTNGSGTDTFTVTAASTMNDLQGFLKNASTISPVSFMSAVDATGHLAVTTVGGVAGSADDVAVGGTLATALGLSTPLAAGGGVAGTSIGTVALGTGAFGKSPDFIPAVGSVFTLGSTSGVNDGVYKVVASDGTNIDIESVPAMTAETTTTASISATSWYKGDTLQIQQRIDTNRTLDVGIYASDPAFEKAIRAMGLLAQGSFGTAGGLDNNRGRVESAIFLLNDALSAPASGNPPFGAEQAGDIDTLKQNIELNQAVIAGKNAKHTLFMGFLDARITDMEQIDPTTAATNLLTDSNALQASYQVLAKVQSLSLMDYLK